jgi:hypothetical protein
MGYKRDRGNCGSGDVDVRLVSVDLSRVSNEKHC